MGCNYYIKNVFEQFSDDQKYHIGKMSYGWAFIFQGNVHKTFNEWVNFIENLPESVYIFNEYEELVYADDFLRMVRHSQGKLNNKTYIQREDVGDREKRFMNKLFEDGKIWIDEGFTFNDFEFC